MKVLLSFLIILTSAQAEAKVVTKLVQYKDKETVLEGYLAYNDALKGKVPGVLLVHDWLGVGPEVKRRAEMVAALGYVAFAADIYGKGIHPAPSEAGALAGKYKNDRALMRERVLAGWNELKKQKSVDTRRIAAIGYCFGGTTVLELARSGADLSGVISFHGGLSTPNTADAKNIKASILVLHGADDPNVPDDEVKKFEEEMRAGKVDWELVKYANAVHSFTNPGAGNDNSKGAAYNETADRRSWVAMKSLFNEIFAK